MRSITAVLGVMLGLLGATGTATAVPAAPEASDARGATEAGGADSASRASGQQGGGGALSLLVATEGRASTSAAYPFVVDEGTSISGRLRFLSYEYPEYYGSEFNDLYSVALATPQGAIVLATGNLNNSTWGEGALGYTGGATTVEFNEELSRFAGQTVELQIQVANVADTLYDSAVAVFDLRIDDRPPCSDDQLRQQHGVPDGGGTPERDRLDGFDRHFGGRSGAKLKNLVESVAAEAGISAGLLAVNALTERSSPAAWFTSDGVQTQHAGVDDWATLGPEIQGRVPGAPAIAAQDTGQVFDNEQGRQIPVLEFANGRDALRAMAWTLRYAEVRMTEDGGAGYGDLPAGERYALQRFAFNRGIPAAVELVRQATGGQGAVLVDQGAIGPSHPQRTATVRAAQAVHLANAVFGEGASCP